MSRPMSAWVYQAPTWSDERDGLQFNRWGKPMTLGGWPDLARRLMRFGPWAGDKRRSPPPLWSPVEMEPGKRKSIAADIAWVHCLVMDYDDGTTIDEAKRRWEPWEYVLHTSWSHSAEHHKVRVVLPLLEPVRGEVWRAVYTEVLAWDAERSGLAAEEAAAAGLQADRACKDPSRMYYVPAVGESGDIRAHHAAWHGADDSDDSRPWLCLSEMLAMAQKRAEAAEAERARRRAEVARRTRDEVGSVADAAREVRRRLMEDPDAREALGPMLGGSRFEYGATPMYRHIACPGCSQGSVWYLVEPEALRRARCNHLESCGWEGHLWELASLHGVPLT